MYKIYNNEIKILQFLKGGSIFTSLAKSGSFNLHPIEKKVYQNSKLTQNNGDFGFLLNFDDDINFNSVRPLLAQEIIFEKFNQKMFIAIILTLNMFKKYEDFLVADATLEGNFTGGRITNVPGSTKQATTLDDAKKIRKNLVILGISVLKALGLYDHNANSFVEYDDFKKKVVGNGSGGTGGGLVDVFDDSTSVKDLAKTFEESMIDDITDFRNITITITGTPPLLVLTNTKQAIKDIETAVFQPASNFIGGTGSTTTIQGGFSLKSFYGRLIDLKPLVLTDGECKKVYFKQIFRPPLNPLLVNQRFIGGGSYDQLQYMLNGGSLNSIVRIPNLSSYFKTQLKFVEHKLKINNKTLSEKSKADIMQIIDALDKHEQNLKEQFELLKNAHLIDEDVIKIDEDAAKLKKAKNSLNKHIRYSGALGDIIRTILKEFKDEVTPKAAFENL